MRVRAIRIALATSFVFAGGACLPSLAQPHATAEGRVLVLDDFGNGLAAWEPRDGAIGAVGTVPGADGDGVLNWALGDVEGSLLYRRMDRVADLGRYNRLVLRLRGWDDEGRVGVGCAARASLELSGYPAHKHDQIPSWGLYDRDPRPSRDWRELTLAMDFPEWYPWGERDNHTPGLWVLASAGFSKQATLQVDEIRLLDDVVAVRGDWGRLAQGQDGARWVYTLRLTNRTDVSQPVTVTAVPPVLERFTAELGTGVADVPPRRELSVRVCVRIPQSVVDTAPALYHEDLFVCVTPQRAPATSTVVRLPATVPMGRPNRPCLRDSALEWEAKRAAFGQLGTDAKLKALRQTDEWLGHQVALPRPYRVDRDVQLVDGTVLRLPQVVGWRQRCPECNVVLRNFPEPNTATCHKCTWGDSDSDWARWHWHQEYFKAVEKLGEAYQLTADERYAAKAAEILKAYASEITRYPLRGISTASEQGWARFALNNLHEAWAIMPVCYGYDMIYDVSGLFTADERQRLHHEFFIPMARSLTPVTSWFTNMTSVRYMAAALCGINAGDSNLLHFAVFGHAGLQRSINASLNPDGFTSEIPMNYHWANLIELVRLALVLKRMGVPVPYRADLLRKACSVPYLRAFPDGTVPGFGPHGRGRGPGYYQGYYPTVAKLFDEPVFRRLAEREQAPQVIKELASVRFPHTELIVLRQGTGAGQHAVSFLFGNKRRCHDAATAFTWYGHGQLLAPAVGSLYNITSPPEAWVSPFYCQLNVDDLHQVDSTGVLTYHHFGPGAQIASAQANELFPGVAVERTLALHEGKLFIADRLVSEQEHTYQWAYLSHGKLEITLPETSPAVAYRREKLDLAGRRVDGPWRAEWRRDQLRLRLHMLGCQSTDVVSGDSYVSPGTEAEKTPLVLARRRAQTALFLAVLEPYSEQARITAVAAEPVALPATQAAALRVTTETGSVVFAVNYSGKPVSGRGWTVSGRAGVVELP